MLEQNAKLFKQDELICSDLEIFIYESEESKFPSWDGIFFLDPVTPFDIQPGKNYHLVFDDGRIGIISIENVRIDHTHTVPSIVFFSGEGPIL